MNTDNHLKMLPKSRTGIRGLDEITKGGIPAGRPTLICGNTGCGKTLLAMEILVRGAILYDEPGVFVSFEETEKELSMNVASLGFDLDKLVEEKKLLLDFIHVERSEIEENGEYNLEGLFIRLGHAIESIGAKRVVIDTIETLFAVFSNELILRAELRRLFRWLKNKGVTTIITGERKGESLTRQGMKEYVSDCVILLDHRASEQTSTRRLRIIKYRGSSHGANEYPFLIDERGFSIVPITSVGLEHQVTSERLSSGVQRLDEMMGGRGFYRGSTILISGTAGTGKSSLSAHFTEAACGRGERVLYFALEESSHQIMRNMRSIGIDLRPWVNKGLLKFHSKRPTFYGLESYLTIVHKEVQEFEPKIVILDPVSSFIVASDESQAKSMIMRLVDYLKMNQITGFMTNLTESGTDLEHTRINISSLIDTWILLRDIELSGERNRGLYILKSRGMSHSNQIREFRLTNHGFDLLDVYVGPGGVLTGSARVAQEAKETAEKTLLKQIAEQKKLDLQRKRTKMEAEIAALRAEFEAEEMEALKLIAFDEEKFKQLTKSQHDIAVSRKAGDQNPPDNI